MSASFTNPARYQARRRFRSSDLPVAPAGAAVLSREWSDVLETVVKGLGVEARRTYGGSADVRSTILRWPISAELVIVAKSSPKTSGQLHYAIVGGKLVYQAANGELALADVSGPAEALAGFVEALRSDVAQVLAGSRFEGTLASMPVMTSRRIN